MPFKVKISYRDDIFFTEEEQEILKLELKKIQLLVLAERLYVTINSEQYLATHNIYFYNTYYYFPSVSKVNSFKLVKRGDETNTSAISSGNQVFLININGKYLQNDYTFGDSSTNNLILEVHGYQNNFQSIDDDGMISIKDSFKLEVLVSVVILPEETTIIETNIGTNIINSTNIIFGAEFINKNLDNFSQDTTWTNPGIDPTILTEEIFLSQNIEDYITDPDQFNDVYLVDERWLTYTENSLLEPTYNYTLDDDHSESKKFKNGIKVVDTVIADYVFEDDYKLESIEDHANFMFKNKHLPALESIKTFLRSDAPMRREQMVEELEKAHIYIYQLNKEIQELKKIFKNNTNS